MDCDRFDIALFRFPFSEKSGRKIRPALVLSPADFNRSHAHAMMAMITTAAHVIWPSDIAIEDFAAAGLKTPSVIRWKLFTLEESLYLGRLGALSSADQSRVEKAISAILGPRS